MICHIDLFKFEGIKMIIEWPKSQICMDCVYACWLEIDNEKSIVYPATVCQKNYSFDGTECSHRIDICSALSVELISFSGFMWECPGCGKTNNEAEKQEKVVCKTCDCSFKVETTIHKNGP